jgi:tRNA A37 methylthiotransferase MiaB
VEHACLFHAINAGSLSTGQRISLAELAGFLTAARLDAVGVFGYSDEDGTEAVSLDGKVSDIEIRARVEFLNEIVEELTAQRAEDRIGSTVQVLVESIDEGVVEGRADHQGPEVDGSTMLSGAENVNVGEIVTATVVGTDGVDLIAKVLSA